MTDEGALKPVTSIGREKFYSDSEGYLYVKGFGKLGHEEECLEVGRNLLGLFEAVGFGESFDGSERVGIKIGQT